MSGIAFLGLILSCATGAAAQTSIVIPDASTTTTLNASVAEQAQVALPASVSFNVTDVNSATAVTNLSITVSGIVLASATKQLRISVQANAATFTAPAGASTTWSASDVSWSFTGGTPWTNGVGTEGTLSNTAFNTVATCNAGVASCSTTRLKFQLGPKSIITRSGSYAIVVTWKVESIGT